MLPITQLQKLSARDQSLVIYPRSQSVRASVLCYFHMCFPGGSAVSPGEGNGHPLRYSFLENSMDIGAWWATVHGVTKSQTRLSAHTCISIFLSEREGFFITHHNISMLWSPKNWFCCCLVATSLSLFTFMHWRRKWQPTPVLLPGESQGQGSLVGCRLWGRTESDTTDVT